MSDLMVSEAMAELFYDQCGGESNGHMAAIPNSPILQSILNVHKANTREEFAGFLRQVAEQLTKEQPF